MLCALLSWRQPLWYLHPWCQKICGWKWEMNGGNRWPYFIEYTKAYGKGLLNKFGTVQCNDYTKGHVIAGCMHAVYINLMILNRIGLDNCSSVQQLIILPSCWLIPSYRGLPNSFLLWARCSNIWYISLMGEWRPFLTGNVFLQSATSLSGKEWQLSQNHLVFQAVTGGKKDSQTATLTALWGLDAQYEESQSDVQIIQRDGFYWTFNLMLLLKKTFK